MSESNQSCRAEGQEASGASDGPGSLGDGSGPGGDGALVVELPRDRRFKRWFAALPVRVQAWVELKIHRFAEVPSLLWSGTQSLGGGLRELRHLGTGPGYRVYLTVTRNRLIILGGGDKSGQAKDVQRARQRLRDLHREGGHAQADHRPNGQQS